MKNIEDKLHLDRIAVDGNLKDRLN